MVVCGADGSRRTICASGAEKILVARIHPFFSTSAVHLMRRRLYDQQPVEPIVRHGVSEPDTRYMRAAVV